MTKITEWTVTAVCIQGRGLLTVRLIARGFSTSAHDMACIISPEFPEYPGPHLLRCSRHLHLHPHLLPETPAAVQRIACPALLQMY